VNRYFHMDEKMFDLWEDMLLDEAYDWRQIGISNDYCNKISVPRFGLRLLNWPRRSFESIDKKKYMMFLLKYR